MASPTLPIQRLINISVTFTPSAAQFPNLSTCLVLGTSDVIDSVTRMETFASLDEVGALFGTDAEEYAAAEAWFAQKPQPTSLNIGRWVNAASSGQLFGGAVPDADKVIGPWNAINAGSFTVTIDGVGPQNIGNLDFTGAANLNAVAAIIESGFPGGTATCVWDATNFRFIITSVSTGANSDISFLTAGATGTDISAMMAGLAASAGAFVAPGLDAQTALDTVVLFDNQFPGQWYGLDIPSLGSGGDDVVAVATAIEAMSNKHFYFITTDEVGCITQGNQTNIAYLLKQLAFTRSYPQYSSTDTNAALSCAARILTTNWEGQGTTISLMYKTLPGIVAENLTTTQANALASVNCNVYAAYANGIPIEQTGITPSGQFADSVIGVDWLVGALQTNGFNALYTTTTKVPQTDPGMNTLSTAFTAACQQGVINGLLAPGIWTGETFGQLQDGQWLDKGFYVYQPPISTQAVPDRAARQSVAFQIAAKLAGAVNDVIIGVVINQ